jgi:hypothetical protein
MSLSFHGSQEKMGHRYTLFKDPGSEPDFPIRLRRIEFNPGIKRMADAPAYAQRRCTSRVFFC